MSDDASMKYQQVKLYLREYHHEQEYSHFDLFLIDKTTRFYKSG